MPRTFIEPEHDLVVQKSNFNNDDGGESLNCLTKSNV